MKQPLFSKHFLGMVIGYHLLFICAQIYNYTRIISSSYTKQKNEKLWETLVTKQQELTQQLYACKDLKKVKSLAKNQLGMKKVRLAQMRQLAHHDR